MQSALKTTALDVGYNGKAVVANLNLSLDLGESLALVGVNGSGKTTLLRTIAGLLPQICGTITALEKPPGKSPTRVAYLGQFHPSSSILPLRVIDIVRTGRYAHLGLLRRTKTKDKDAVIEALIRMNIYDLRDVQLHLLSGGQRQKVFIATALARTPKLLLLDEPASNLDMPSVQEYRTILQQLAANGVSSIIATHDIEEARLCTQTLLLNKSVLAYGKSEEVLQSPALLSAFGVPATIQNGKVVLLDVHHSHD